MTIQMVFILSGFIGGLISVAIFTYLLTKNHNAPNTKLMYIAILLIHIWLSIIYGLVAFGVLDIKEYGNYVRPILLLVLLSPAYVALLHRKPQ